jgi:hypothetical protein
MKLETTKNDLADQVINEFPIFETQEELDSYIQLLEDQIIYFDQITINLKHSCKLFEKRHADQEGNLNTTDSWYKKLLKLRAYRLKNGTSFKNWIGKKTKRPVDIKIKILENALDVVSREVIKIVQSDIYIDKKFIHIPDLSKNKAMRLKAIDLSQDHFRVLLNLAGADSELSPDEFPQYLLTDTHQKMLQSEIKFLRSNGRS